MVENFIATHSNVPLNQEDYAQYIYYPTKLYDITNYNSFMGIQSTSVEGTDCLSEKIFIHLSANTLEILLKIVCF